EAWRIADGVGREACSRAGVWSGQLLVVGQAVDQLEQARHVSLCEGADERGHVDDSRSRITRPAGGLGKKYVDFSGIRSPASATASTLLTGVALRKNAADARPERTSATASCGLRV